MMFRGYPERVPPRVLPENGGCAFQGWNTTSDLLWSEVPLPGYRPALGGKEVNTHPKQLPHRWARPNKRKPGLETAFASLSRCLVTARVTKHLCFSFQPTDRIFSEAMYVFLLDHYAAFAVLQSRVHEPWARPLSSSMKTDLRYAASDCFATFPFPKPDPRAKHPALENAGEKLYEARAKFMVDTHQGLTKTYNALKDPDCTDRTVLKLRDLHEAMDAAVLAAYGWDDIEVPPFEVDSKKFRLDVIDRLYELNAARGNKQ